MTETQPKFPEGLGAELGSLQLERDVGRPVPTPEQAPAPSKAELHHLRRAQARRDQEQVQEIKQRLESKELREKLTNLINRAKRVGQREGREGHSFCQRIDQDTQLKIFRTRINQHRYDLDWNHKKPGGYDNGPLRDLRLVVSHYTVVAKRLLNLNTNVPSFGPASLMAYESAIKAIETLEQEVLSESKPETMDAILADWMISRFKYVVGILELYRDRYGTISREEIRSAQEFLIPGTFQALERVHQEQYQYKSRLLGGGTRNFKTPEIADIIDDFEGKLGTGGKLFDAPI